MKSWPDGMHSLLPRPHVAECQQLQSSPYRPSSTVRLQRHAARHARVCRLNAKSSTNDELSERLRKAEAEAKDLRERLAAAGTGEKEVSCAYVELATYTFHCITTEHNKGRATQSKQESAPTAKKPSRIDGSILRREGGGGKGDSKLACSDICACPLCSASNPFQVISLTSASCRSRGTVAVRVCGGLPVQGRSVRAAPPR